MGSLKWTAEFLENEDNLRPPTPTGCLVDTDPDVLLKSKPTSRTVEEVDRPPTPGKGIAAELANAEFDEVFSPSSASSELLGAPSDLLPASYLLYEEMPKTPGREERSLWINYSSGRAPATPGRGPAPEGSTVCSALRSPSHVLPPSSFPYITPPKTPGRDIVLPQRSIVHRRTTQEMNNTPTLLHNNFLRSSPITVSSPSTLSESSSDTDDGSGVSITSVVRSKPLQGLENMPCLLDEEKPLLRQKMRRKFKRRRRACHQQRSFKNTRSCLMSNSCPDRWCSLCEDRRILHSVWKEGLDEEDARLLKCTYERLQERDNGVGWLSDTCWIPHPHILFCKDFC